MGIHCEFGDDWFDLKIWNVKWSNDPETMYHHRVKKTRLMRDIVPSESHVEAVGNHVYVHLKKVKDPRHGYCAWPELCAGKGRKPFKYQEDAPDGGLMEFSWVNMKSMKAMMASGVILDEPWRRFTEASPSEVSQIRHLRRNDRLG